jgi:hypothetical protein
VARAKGGTTAHPPPFVLGYDSLASDPAVVVLNPHGMLRSTRLCRAHRIRVPHECLILFAQARYRTSGARVWARIVDRRGTYRLISIRLRIRDALAFSGPMPVDTRLTRRYGATGMRPDLP